MKKSDYKAELKQLESDWSAQRELLQDLVDEGNEDNSSRIWQVNQTLANLEEQMEHTRQIIAWRLFSAGNRRRIEYSGIRVRR